MDEGDEAVRGRADEAIGDFPGEPLRTRRNQRPAHREQLLGAGARNCHFLQRLRDELSIRIRHIMLDA